MKKEVIWALGFVVVTITLVGQMTSFTFENIDVQLYDTYYILPSWLAGVFVLIVLGLSRGLLKIIDRLSDQSRFLALAMSIIVGLSGLVLIVIISFAIRNLIQVKEWYPDLDISSYVGIAAILISLLLLLTITEVKIIKKLRPAKK